METVDVGCDGTIVIGDTVLRVLTVDPETGAVTFSVAAKGDEDDGTQ